MTDTTDTDTGYTSEVRLEPAAIVCGDGGPKGAFPAGEASGGGALCGGRTA